MLFKTHVYKVLDLQDILKKLKCYTKSIEPTFFIYFNDCSKL